MYRRIFTKEFNIGFFVPKKDRCDLFEEYKMSQHTVNEIPILKTKYDDHMKDKACTRTERTNDRDNDDEKVITVCFDMENVLTCPRANVSNFFYKRKLNVFNLTAHCSKDKVAYNIIWNECIASRGANELASALIIVLDKVPKRHPDTEKLILWSDSCVPQNRNSMMTSALKWFLSCHPELVSIEQKICTPGHSNIQEVDNIHSHIEKKIV